MMMDNDIFSVPLPSPAVNSIGIDSSVSHLFPDSLDLMDSSSRSCITVGYPIIQDEVVDGLHRPDHGYVGNANTGIPRDIPLDRFAPQGFVANTEIQEQFIRAPISVPSQFNVFAGNDELRGHFLGSPMHVPSGSPFEELKAVVAPVASNVSNAFMAASGYYGVESSKFDWNSNNCHMDPYTYSNPRKELSLSLAMSQPSMDHSPTILDQHSRHRFSTVDPAILGDAEYVTNIPNNEVQHSSCVTQFSSEDAGMVKGLQSEHSTSNIEEFYNGYSSVRTVRFPHVFLGSKYLQIAHQILSEVFHNFTSVQQDLCKNSYGALFDGIDSQTTICNSSCGPGERESLILDTEEFAGTAEETPCCSQWKSSVQRLEPETKTDLLALLQEVEHRHDQCHDQFEMVISSFQAATEVDPPQLHARLALQTVSGHFKRLRKKIIHQILASQKHLSSPKFNEKDDCLDPASIQKQWTLQRLRRAEQLPWRPQRGLPERSVSVLRAWLFENFLHPYPKDGQKYILARQSGLTKSQVSNWFINARVRIWKPLIEEMYMEINKKVKAGKEIFARSAETEDGASATRKS
ncbi:homeobox protein ATH1-like [Nymphaea colorata]|uniref:homeobox protein ATH1-like n=1 Tax=Nymphaea colorata TaxID=210225 RepID=UPI00129E6FAE|nr:homeobox protein ATH1-like [Nymphaea colorata]XP_031487015.1 homeobox protein ATH1-like [Nymphaea colorata]XP_031487016.1 homeobox protein ATH1-like [Nymphaea colorata]XP_031487017.1 homeobox protein ATH1-like [Nymphaea colorata]XP_049934517.1 homeobox protein ATH1-like [Nymphaea colorata]